MSEISASPSAIRAHDPDNDPAMIQARNLAVVAAGGPVLLGKKLGISRSAVVMWKIVPVLRVPDVERITGISRYVLRPDFFGPGPAPKRHRQSTGQEAA